MADKGKVLGLFSIALAVSDSERSKAFYSKLGFQVEYETSIPLENGAIKITRLGLNGMVIELAEGPSYDTQIKNGHFDHVTLRVTNIEDVVKSLQEKGIQFDGEVGITKPFLKNGIKFIFLHGPDQESLALTEELK